MKPNPSQLRRAFFALLFTALATFTASAQSNQYWNTNGNAATNGNFLGTTNNEPLIFKTNGLEALRVKPNGEIKIAAFENIGKGLVTFNNNGVLTSRVFPNDTNQVFTGSGNFKSIATLSGWTRTGNVLYNSTGVNVGIGIQNPAYPLEVQGSAFFHGTVYATGVVLVNKILVDTLKATDMFSLNNNLHMTGGGFNQIYTSNAELRFQSNAGNTYNTIFSAGTSGNVGIGTFNPQAKLDVNGSANISGKLTVFRIAPLPGDTMIRFGDSTITLTPYSGNICNVNSAGFRGLGIGNYAYGFALHSNAIGYNVRANGEGSIALGASNGGVLVNNTPWSLIVGFKSNIPTLFVGPGSGNGTLGRVGIGTTSPDGLFQVEGGINRIVLDQCGTNNQGFVSYIGFNASRDVNTGLYKFLGDGAQNNSGSLIMQDNEGALHFYVAAKTGGADQQKNTAIIETQSIMTLRTERVQIGDGTILPTSIYNTPDTKLTVDGRIMCKDFVVSIDADWPDYVFDSTYVLMPMDSLDTYVHTNMHLPASVPADSVAANGVSYVELCAQQQKQIEELTLYILQLNARLSAVEKKENQPAEGGQK